ncbi:LPXTG cell wall anchor domain-containing protein [Actinomyces qiguomingii]|uniref:LPXTG cell wall anchor domain-containing protein n=1 Tax=Actinomyces qiguomingii TaxID=2057800 RepID=UPI000CA0087B|nr:LPXTG cell wall anchor domain-containing protein [Actinomyces qiguomingii]
MRLGRSITTIGATAALVAGGLAVSTPALADTTEDGFTLDAPTSRVVDPNSSITVTGSGCGSAQSPAQVRVALTNDNEASTQSSYVTTTAGADGSWTATLDLSTAVAEVGGDPNVDPWYIIAQCVSYNESLSGVAGEQIILDGTSFDGSYIIHGDVAGQQSFEITASGLTPGETVTNTLIREADADSADAAPVATIGTGTVDQDGNFNGTFPAPSVPDGTYVLRLAGSRYGEGGDSVSLVTVSGGVYSNTARNDNRDGDTTITDNNKTNTGTGTNTSATVAATVPAKASGKELAKTGGAGLTLSILAAGLLASGAVILRARRRA